MKLYAYLAGPVEFAENGGIEWREEVEEKLKEIGIICFSPMKKPTWLPSVAKLNPKEYGNTINDAIFNNKDIDLRSEFEGLRIVRKFCLQMINVSDFAICRLPDVITAGTYEELGILKNCGKPVFFCAPDKKIPAWVYAMFRDRTYYDSNMNSLIQKIKYKVENISKMSTEEKLEWLKLTYWK